MLVDVDRLRADLAAHAAGDAFSGVVRVDGSAGIVLEQAYGLASYTWGVPTSPATRFDTASITKLFTAVATLQQVEAGSFALDTGVIDYLGLAGTTISHDVTVYHLLTHSSGIGDDADEEAGESYEALWADRPNYSVRETADFLPGFVHKPPNFAPGAGCRYCNVGFVLLGLMIERATGAAYRDYVRDRVFDAAGMTSSGFFSMDEVVADVAEGVEPVTVDDGTVTGWRRNVYSYPPVGSPDGGAHVTAGDLIRFHGALLDGALLLADSVEAMLSPQVPYRDRGRGKHWTGFGFELETDADGTVRSYWKEGINVGASGMLRHYPAPGLTVAVLSNLERGAWEPLSIVDRHVGGRLTD
jgi:CubicO group peptidase (beta-lactamase class C family)